MRRLSRVILAVDSDPPMETLEAVLPHVDGVKLGLPLLLSRGPEHLRAVADLVTDAAADQDDQAGLGVVVDLKLADIPDINRRSVEACMALGATYVICHGFTGADSVQAVVEAVEAGGGEGAFVVAEMSHPGGATFFQPAAEAILEVAKKAGAFGVVAPATRPERVAHLRGRAGDLKLACPGVGAQGGDARTVLDAGADWIIVGRAILTADDPVEAARELAGAAGDAAEDL